VFAAILDQHRGVYNAADMAHIVVRKFFQLHSGVTQACCICSQTWPVI